MFTRFVSILMEFKSFMGVTAAVTLAGAGIYLLALPALCWDKRRIRIFGLFYGLGNRQMAAMSLLYLRLMYVLSCIFGQTDVKSPQILMLAAFGILGGAAAGMLPGLIQEAVNTVLLTAGLVAGNLLLSYVREIQFEWSIMAVYYLLGLFMFLYCLYFFIKDIRNISRGRQEKHVTVTSENQEEV